jgi:N-acetylmuramoyl-L-alanine amidase
MIRQASGRWLILLSVWAGLSVTAAAQTLAVTAVRHWSLGDVTRIAIETNGPFEFHHEKLSNPDRLFFDIQGSRKFQGGGRGIHKIQVEDALISQIRIAQTQRSVTRVVLDLKCPVEEKVSRLANPNRLIVELKAAGPAAPSSPVSPVPGTPPIEPGLPKTPELTAAPAALGPVAAKASVSGSPGRLTPDSSTAEADFGKIPLPASRNSNGSRSLTRALGLKLGRVVLDPGHGGHDHGTEGPSGLLEKELVLDVALRLGNLIETKLGSEVVYTRKDDRFIPLEERTALANSNKADLFLSIHANASPQRAASGVETFYLNFTDSPIDLEVAARENAGHGKSIYELKDLIQKIALKEKLQESREFAEKIQSALYPAVVKANPRAKNRGVKKAPFVVLIGASMPSVLTEIGFVSNTREEKLLKSPEHRQRIAEALFKGISQYAESLSRFSIAQRQEPESESKK